MTSEVDNAIPNFLSDLSENFKNKTDKERMLIIEFFLKYNFLCRTNELEISEKDLIKYLSLGWYIYNEKERLSEAEN